MRISVDRECGGALEEAVAALLAVEPHLAYGNFPPLAERTRDLHRRWWLAAADGEGALVARDEGGRPLATIRLERRAFESAHFGMPIAKIEPPAATPDEDLRLPALRALYAAAWEALGAAGFRRVTGLASTQDRTACWALQEAGGFHVGTKISWMQPLTGEAADLGLAPSLRLEVHERATIPSLAPAAWRRLHGWCSTGFERGPFVFDLGVPADRAAAVYRVWTEKAFSGEWADVLVVVRDGEEIVAFHAVLLLRELSEAAGVGILGRGIGATLPEHRGLFTALQRACSVLRPLDAAWLENETQASTIPSINVFGRLGHRCLRSVASFHAPLDGDPARRRG
ncbi:MAG TPA: hypothetical protein VKA21_06570 [Candidatus Binatia bacterium]|nr:hypothetical protein [Candidatus Binatia bacterium]